MLIFQIIHFKCNFAGVHIKYTIFFTTKYYQLFGMKNVSTPHTRCDYDMFFLQDTFKLLASPGVSNRLLSRKIFGVPPPPPLDHTTKGPHRFRQRTVYESPGRGWPFASARTGASRLWRRDRINRTRVLFHNFWPSMASFRHKQCRC